MLELLLELAAGKLFSGGWDFMICVFFLKRAEEAITVFDIGVNDC